MGLNQIAGSFARQTRATSEKVEEALKLYNERLKRQREIEEEIEKKSGPSSPRPGINATETESVTSGLTWLCAEVQSAFDTLFSSFSQPFGPNKDGAESAKTMDDDDIKQPPGTEPLDGIIVEILIALAGVLVATSALLFAVAAVIVFVTLMLLKIVVCEMNMGHRRPLSTE